MDTTPHFLPHDRLQELFDVLATAGYQIIGPKVRDAAIVFEQISKIEELPRGVIDKQEAGYYRLTQTTGSHFFAFNQGPTSCKAILNPPRRKLWSAHKNNASWEIESSATTDKKIAIFGVRACDLNAILVQDQVSQASLGSDPYLQQQRAQSLIIVVQCSTAAATCFCSSMASGPHAEHGYDLALTELVDLPQPGFLLTIGSAKGQEILQKLSIELAQEEHIAAAKSLREQVERQISRTMPATTNLRTLTTQPHHPQWQDIANRCLSCANCTLVCPTCFCSNIEDVTDLSGQHTERWLTWDSCFTADFSVVHTNPMRASVQSRYRQWLTHKLSTWWDQFGTSGCVGCGRCIAWCPASIDLTQEAQIICRQ